MVARLKEVETISMQMAMDNLATIVSMDLAKLPKIGIIQKHRLITDEEDVGRQDVFWLSAEGDDVILNILDMTFLTVHHHLVALLESNEVNWDDPKIRKGIQSMMVLVAEAAHRMDEYLSIRKGKEVGHIVEERISYQDLQYFYQHRFSKQFKSDDATWSEGVEKSENSFLFEDTKTGLFDLETIKRDQAYELLLIKNENGEPFFNDELLKNIKLVCFDSEKEASFEDDPILRVKVVEDRDLLATSQQILHSCKNQIEAFYQIYGEISKLSVAKHLSSAIVALFLTANPRNLIQNSASKTCSQYFHDFQKYLRLAMHSDEYQKYIAYPTTLKQKIPFLLLQLIHALCFAIYSRVGGVKQEAIALFHRWMRKGEEKDRKIAIKGDTIWNQLLIDDEKFRSLLGQFPSGPLFKILDQIRNEDPESMSFDPIMQNNIPQILFEIDLKDHPVQVIRMPSPVRQAFINKVSIAEEFLGFLRNYGSQKPGKKHLIINFQDRAAWQEYVRSISLESLQKNAEFSNQLIVVTLPKNSDFYHQNAEFMNLGSADQFIGEFKKELSLPEEFGFLIPPQISGKDFEKFVDQSLSLVHEAFFNSKSNLSRQNREDFVEIFYQLLILKCIEIIEPDSISFVCKDGIDTSAAAIAAFYGFLQMLQGDISKEVDYLRYLLYSGAFFVRERAIDPERLNRALSALDRIDSSIEENKSIQKHLADLYPSKFIKNLKIRHL